MSSFSSKKFIDTGTKTGIIVSATGHVLLLVLALAVFSGGSSIPVYSGGNAVTVEMITLAPPESVVQENSTIEEIPTPEIPHETEEVVEVIEEPVPLEENTEPETASAEETAIQENHTEYTSAQSEFMAVGSGGEAGTGTPGPATYEGRVFSAIRRNFRTSVQPGQSFRICFVVNLDGSVDWDIVRTSGEPAFDRAVEHAVTMAAIPPIPPGRSQPVVLNIEFFGPEL